MFTIKFTTLVARLAIATATVVSTALVTKASVEGIGRGLSKLGNKIEKTASEMGKAADRAAA